MSIGEPTVGSLISVEEFLDLPNEDIDRDIIDGVLREWVDGATLHSPNHGEAESSISYALRNWSQARPGPKGKVVGNVGFRIRVEPLTFVGADVAYVSPAMAAAHDRKRKFFDGPPLLAVEILSPSDKHEKVTEKVDKYLEAGCIVWVVDPDFRTVTVHRPDLPAAPFGVGQEIDAEPYLPGFRAPVARFFDA